MKLEKLLVNCSEVSVLIPVIAGIRSYPVLTLPFKILFYFFVLSGLFEIQSRIAIVLWQNNMPGQHLFTVVQFIAFTLLFLLHTQRKSLRVLLVANMLVLFGFALFNAITSIKDPNSLARGYAAASLTVYALIYLYYLFAIDSTRYVWQYPMFWICIGILMYFTVNFMYIMTKQYLIAKHLDVEWVGHLLHSVLNIIAHCLYAQAFTSLRKWKTAS
ncbi:hypothetical protein [Taibaiella chishuiensis]|uniref:Uncharacterized protein n=1 Tax=Taibaiella chishuiensis TaxID=1434707 RepID=A0A2P8D8D1_9BACT|nr:hypothetical protein [Taibaiella chishuiensis]PSK93490.1 hypothetical protein B0I18_102460 [Taibaiella chishuiensis]